MGSLPLLPMRINVKLLFPLYHACVESCWALCIYSKDNEILVGSWYFLELNQLLEKGYRVCEIYEV